MKNTNTFIQNGQQLHDAAIARIILSLYTKGCSWLSSEAPSSAHQGITDRIQRGQRLHDAEIGSAMKSCFTLPKQQVKEPTRVAHHVAH